MKEKSLKIIIAVLAVLLIAGAAAYAATNYGTKDDPLITKSYLDEVVKPQLESDMKAKLDAASAGRSSRCAELSAPSARWRTPPPATPSPRARR